jgi:acyl carrier protein
MEAIPESDPKGSGSTTPGSQPIDSTAGDASSAGISAHTPLASGEVRRPHAEGFQALGPAHSGSGPNQRLTEILVRISGADAAQIKPEARLIEDIGIDSLGFYEILIEADECLGIKIREEDLLKFRTVGDIQEHLRQLYPPDAEAN